MATLLILLSGFLIGMRHALESDHLAAVTALAADARGVGHTVRLGVNWGVGHTLTLFAFGAVVLLVDGVVPERFANGLEFAVGIMLMVLGVDVIRRMRRRRVHFHVHEHGDGVRHIHVHAHDGSLPHGLDPHDHAHPERLLQPRALLVGMVHGMAGTAALILLTLQTLHDVGVGLLYILLFGIGSVLGMGAISAIIALPLRATAAGRGLRRWHAGLQLAIGLFTSGYGALIAWRLAPAVFAPLH